LKLHWEPNKLERGGRSPGGAFVNKSESPRLVRSQGTVTVTVPVVLSSTPTVRVTVTVYATGTSESVSPLLHSGRSVPVACTECQWRRTGSLRLLFNCIEVAGGMHGTRFVTCVASASARGADCQLTSGSRGIVDLQPASLSEPEHKLLRKHLFQVGTSTLNVPAGLRALWPRDSAPACQ
jgi:hypothetical protein